MKNKDLEFVDIDIDIKTPYESSPELKLRDNYEYLVRCATNDFTSPLNEYQKAIINKFLVMNCTCFSYAIDLAVIDNNGQMPDGDMIYDYRDKISYHLLDNTKLSEEKIKKANAWFDSEVYDSLGKEDIVLIDDLSNVDKNWN